jgi:HAD domain in Swiss Army Knife RNA repair proteins
MYKAILLDFDGPMIPMRAYCLPNQTNPFSMFDPVAAGMINRLIKFSGAKLVISSTWRYQGYVAICEVLSKNGIDPAHLHEDWRTQHSVGSSTRTQECVQWIKDHPEVTHHVAIDDEQLDYDPLPCAVQCDPYEGLSWRNYLECCVHLDAYEYPDISCREKYLEQILYYKRREIWRTKRRNEPGAQLTRDAAEIVFPTVPPNDDKELS